MCYGLVWREGKSAGSFITLPILNQFPFLLIRFPLKDVVSVELEFFDAFPDVIKCSERELRRVSKCLGTSPAMPRPNAAENFQAAGNQPNAHGRFICQK